MDAKLRKPAGGWMEAEHTRSGKGVIGQRPERMLQPGFYETLPTAGEEFSGAFPRTEEGSWVCKPDMLGGYEWKLLGEEVLVPESGLTLLETLTWSGVTSKSFSTGILTSVYDSYLLLVDNLANVTNGADIFLRLRLAGTDASGASDYIWSSVGASSETADSEIELLTNSGTTFTHGMVVLQIFRPALADETTFLWIGSMRSGGTISGTATTGSGVHTLATAYDSFTLLSSAGNFSGSARLYGYQNTPGTYGAGYTPYTDEMARDAIGAALVAGSNITITVSDVGNTITIDSTAVAASGGSVPDILMLGGM